MSERQRVQKDMKCAKCGFEFDICDHVQIFFSIENEQDEQLQAADALAKAGCRLDEILTVTSQKPEMSEQDVWDVGPAVEAFKDALAAYEKVRHP